MQQDAVSLGRYQTAWWTRAYWWFGLAVSVGAGGALVITALVVRGGASIALVLIGAGWIVIAAVGIRSVKRLAWSVEVTLDSIGFNGPRLHLQIPPAELVEVRPATARGDIAGRGAAHEALTVQNGTIRLGPSRDVSGFFAALRRVNPNVKLPDDAVRE